MKANKQIGEPLLIHKKGSKVVGLHCNPADSDLFISCGNDHMVSTGKDSHDLIVTAELIEVIKNAYRPFCKNFHVCSTGCLVFSTDYLSYTSRKNN